MSVLNAYLERAAQVAHAGKVWHRAPGQMFLGADNSRGNGDTGGRFAGVNAMNTALLDRFSLVVPCTYLPAQVEAEALIRHTGCSQVLADHVIAALNLARGKVESGEIIDPPSLRQAIYFVEALRAMPPAEAWTWAIVTRQPGESEAGLAALYSTAINESLITAEV
jgi:MoxR-like ATPase